MVMGAWGPADMVEYRNLSRPAWKRDRFLIATTLVALLVPEKALAQAGGQEVNSFELTPRVSVTYDSNVFQINPGRFGEPRDDVVVTPAVTALFNRTIGRNSVSVNGDVGYTLHDRYKSLDQLVVSGSGSGSLALTSYCRALPNATVTKQQNNLTASSAIKNSQTFQNYTLTLSCQRPFGLYPSATVGYQTTTNSSDTFDLFNQRTFRYSGGIGYAVPSLGSLLLSVGETRIRQPNRDELEAIEEGSNVFNVGVTVSRAVAPRLSFSAGARYLKVDPLRGGTQGYSGIGYNASVDYHPSPRLSLIANADRDVTGSGDVAVSYVLASVYGVTGIYTLSVRTSLRASAQYFDRTYRGENPIFFPFLRGNESGVTLSGSVNRTVGRRINLNAFTNYTSSGAQGTFYDYKRLQAGLSAGFRF